MIRDPRGHQRIVLLEDVQDWFNAAIEESLRHGSSVHNGTDIGCFYIAEKDAVLCDACQVLVKIHDPRRN